MGVVKRSGTTYLGPCLGSGCGLCVSPEEVGAGDSAADAWGLPNGGGWGSPTAAAWVIQGDDRPPSSEEPQAS